MRLFLLCLLLVAESFYLSLRYDAWLLIDSQSGAAFRWIAISGHLVKLLIAFLAAFLLAMVPKLKQQYALLTDSAATHRWLPSAALQVAAYVTLFLYTDTLFASKSAGAGASASVPLTWGALVLLVFGLWAYSFAPLAWWRDIVRREWKVMILAMLAALFAWSIAQSAQGLWNPLSRITFHMSALLLDLVYSDVVMIADDWVLGTSQFLVRINAACSGYEGIGLVTAFLAFYLLVFRDEFRFPHALLLFPVGILSIWFFNCVRIVVLIIIGDAWSRDVALGGFHSQAGWIAFILVTVLLLSIAHRVKAIRIDPQSDVPARGITPNMALLVPLVVLLSSTLLTQAVAASVVDWLYPFRVVATGFAVVLLWHLYTKLKFQRTIVAVAAGIAVFALWIALVPNDAGQNAAMASAFDDAEQWVVYAWLIARTVGAVITVPIAEELAFRGYLLGKLSGSNSLMTGKLPVHWVAIVVSSVAFGLLHTAIVAGVLAGLVYAVVRIITRSTWDAVLAHAVTNALLSAYVLSYGYWSLW